MILATMPPNDSARPTLAPRVWSRLSNLSKRSFRSFTSSAEADDERSSTDDEEGIMSLGSDASGRDGSIPPARYHGEDVRPTSRKELAGWYMYAFAAETYVICGQSSVPEPWPLFGIADLLSRNWYDDTPPFLVLTPTASHQASRLPTIAETEQSREHQIWA